MDPLAQYLDEKSGGGGDPLADYLDEQEGGPESFLHPDKFKPSPIHRKFHNTGPVAQVQHDIEEQRANMPTTTDMVVRDAPGALLSMADRASLGALGEGLKGATRLNEATGTHGPTLASNSLDAIERYRREAPTLSTYTDMPGYLTGAPEAIAGTVERVLPQVVNPVARAARATLGAGLTSAGVAGGEAAVRGDQPAEIAREAGRGFAGGTAVGAPSSAAALLLGGMGRMVLNSKGAQARNYLEARGQPLTAEDTSDAAIGAAAQRADEAVKSRMNAYRGEVASGPYVEEINRIPQEAADQVVNVTPIYRDLQMAANDPANLQVADKLNTLVKMLGDRPLMTQQELNGLRRSLAGIAQVGETTSGKLAPLRRAYEGVKALVDQGPYAEANRRFAEGTRNVDESLGMVGLRRTNNPDEPIAGNLRVRAQRAGQNTVTAGADTESLDLDAFKVKHPELANAIDAPEIIRRQGDIGFHLQPHHGGFIERTAGSMSPYAALALAALGHGWQGIGGLAGMLALQNRNAIAGRLLYGPAQNSALAAQLLLGDIPTIAAPGREVIQEKR